MIYFIWYEIRKSYDVLKSLLELTDSLEVNPLSLRTLWDVLFYKRGHIVRYDSPGTQLYSFGSTKVKIFSNEEAYKKYRLYETDDW